MCLSSTRGVAQKQRRRIHRPIKDFQGKIIAMMEDISWIYYGGSLSTKGAIENHRTKDHRLMFACQRYDGLARCRICCSVPQARRWRSPIQAGKAHLRIGRLGNNYRWIFWACAVWYATDYMPGTHGDHFNGAPCDVGYPRDGRAERAEARGLTTKALLAPLRRD